MVSGIKLDLTGKRFGRWLVLSKVLNKGGQSRWLCQCDCGTKRDLFGSYLSRGRSESCGCIRRIDPNRSEKKCSRCQETKPIAEFFRSKRRADGRDVYCKRCKVEVNRSGQPARYDWHLRKQFGITLADKDLIITDQKGQCPLCRRGLSSPVVDHDHITNEVRGVLCRNCNTWLGAIEADPERVDRTLKYLLTGADHVRGILSHKDGSDIPKVDWKLTL